MINFKQCKMSMAEARAEDLRYAEMEDSGFEEILRGWAENHLSGDPLNGETVQLRQSLVTLFNTTLKEHTGEVGYALDLEMGLHIYSLLNPENGFTKILANDDDFWRFISMNVIPDLTMIRFPNSEEQVEILRRKYVGLSYGGDVRPEKNSARLRTKRFYAHSRRIWIKTLWWYVHLSWQGDAEKTRTILKNNGADIISQCIERTGGGYRLSTYRAMMKAYSKLPDKFRTSKMFRAAARLNLVRCVSVEPALIPGGEEAYAEKLFEDVITKGDD